MPETFEFGKNWQNYAAAIDETRIDAAVLAIREKLEVSRLDGLGFVDVGSGSGLMSLAARRLGARVLSFDVDADSVACTRALKERFFSDDPDWRVMDGSVLDPSFLKGVGTFDIVYSWGVLHHTGDMWRAIENVTQLAKPVARVFIAIYNDQGRTSRHWLAIKRAYNKLPESLRWIVLWPCLVRLWGPTILRDTARGQPLRSWREYRSLRGMSAWHDVVDWVGGYPFEVAKPEEIFDFFRTRGWTLSALKTCGGGLGCNEFVFNRSSADAGNPGEVSGT
ncbi:MAG: class I SAM-dependent methyltransferase [Magnetospirillum sp.]|nr:class I SAM-dependent methyltransferase [Magnetospirillum sp.]